MSFENSMILPAALSRRFFYFYALVSLRDANAAPCRSVSHVDRGWWARFRPSVAVVDGRRFRPTSRHLEFISVSIMFVQQQSEPLVEELNMLTTIRTIGRGAESVVGCKAVFPVLMDAVVSACTFPRPSVVAKYNQLYSEMRNVRACFYDVTTRMVCFSSAKTVLHRSRKV